MGKGHHPPEPPPGWRGGHIGQTAGRGGAAVTGCKGFFLIIALFFARVIVLDSRLSGWVCEHFRPVRAGGFQIWRIP